MRLLHRTSTAPAYRVRASRRSLRGRLLSWLGLPAALAATMLLTAPAAHAEILDQRTLDFRSHGVYAIVHYGVDSQGHYLQFYVHDTLHDGRCAVALADFAVNRIDGHHHIDPGRVTVCTDGAQRWSERWHPDPNDGLTWTITGIRWADACRLELDDTRTCLLGPGRPQNPVHDIPLLP